MMHIRDELGGAALLLIWVGGGFLGSWAIGWSPPLGVMGMWFLAMLLGAAANRIISGSW